MRRANSITAWYSDEEFATVHVYAAAARLAVAAYVAEASLRPSAWQVGLGDRLPGGDAGVQDAAARGVGAAVLQDPPGAADVRQMELLELIGIHRQLRGAATNLNQAVAKLHSLGEPVGELAAIAAYVRRVATAADEAVAAVRMRR